MKKKIPEVLIYVACLVLCFLYTYWAGSDSNWDLINYHLYAPYAYMNDLLGKDFMAASIQSYLNPLPYIPFYLMVRAKWSGLTISLILAAFHALNLFLLWMISRRLFNVAGDTGGGNWPLALMSLGLGAASPLFLMELGTTFADNSTSVFVLAGIWLLLRGIDKPGAMLRHAFFAGLVLGAAAGLKLTNISFAVAACAFGFLPGMYMTRRMRFFASLGTGGVIGALFTTGHWCLALYREFGNPFFPFANGLFRSPDFMPASFHHMRFIPESLPDALLFPFRIANPDSWIYVEMGAPDLRFAVFFIGCLLLALLKMLPMARQHINVRALTVSQSVFISYIFVAWLVWMAMFSNGRYLLPLTLLIGVGCGVVLWRLLSFRYAKLALVLLLTLQLLQLYYGAERRFEGTGEWKENPWFDLDIPEKLISKPYLFLSMNMQSNAYLAAFHHPDSRFVNIVGEYSLDLNVPGGGRLRRLLDEYRGRTRVLFNYSLLVDASEEQKRQYYESYDMHLNRFGLRVDVSDCSMITNRSLNRSLFIESEKPVSKEERYSRVMSCAVKSVPVNPVIESDYARVASIMDRVQKHCPSKFPMTSPVMSRSGKAWSRVDMNMDLHLFVYDRLVIVYAHRMPPLRIDTEKEIDCSLIGKKH